MTNRDAAITTLMALVATGIVCLLSKSPATVGGETRLRPIAGRLCGERPGDSRDSAFLAQIHASMTRMMADMDPPAAGDVDADFVNTMVPHHRGAIDMAEAELVSGTNPQLRRIAQEIIVEQQQEIAAMRFALSEPLPPSMPSPDQTPQRSGT